jgi:DUF4097 and DUF4098 domain-containing protein YvlB
MRHTIWLGLLALAGCELGLAWEGGGAREQAEETRVVLLPHRAGTSLHVQNTSGAVEVRVDPTREDVQLTCTIQAQAPSRSEAEELVAQVELQATRTETGLLQVEPQIPRAPGSSVAVGLAILLPDSAGVTVQVTSGRVLLAGLTGAGDVRSTNGSITIQDHTGAVHLEATNGRLVAERVTGALVGRSSNGSIEVSAISGSVDLESRNGTISASEVGSPVRLRTSNGSIDLHLPPDQPGPIDLATSNGAIRVDVGPAFQGTVHLRSTAGRVRLVDQVSPEAAAGLGKHGGTLRLRSDEPVSTLETGNGSIELRRLPG